MRSITEPNYILRKPFIAWIAISSLASSPTFATASGQASTHNDTLPAIANPTQADQLAREALAQYFNSTPLSPEDCYDLNVDMRDDHNYVVHVSEHPGKKCETIDYGGAFRPFSIEIDAARGSAVVLGYPSQQAQPREIKLFPLEDVPGMPSTQWRLKGTAKQLRHTDECDLSFGVPAFESRNAYSFGLSAKRDTRTLSVSYYVNTVYPEPLGGNARMAFVFGTKDATLATYEATIERPKRSHAAGAVTTNDVSFTFDLDENAAYAFVDTLGRSTQMVPSIDQQPVTALGLSEFDFKDAGGGRNVNDVIAKAFQSCLKEIWKSQGRKGHDGGHH